MWWWKEEEGVVYWHKCMTTVPVRDWSGLVGLGLLNQDRRPALTGLVSVLEFLELGSDRTGTGPLNHDRNWLGPVLYIYFLIC